LNKKNKKKVIKYFFTSEKCSIFALHQTIKVMSNNLTQAFKALRKAGYFARQNFLCCQSCGWAAIPEGKFEKVVFYHAQDNSSKREGRPFNLAWNGNGQEICQILKEHNVETTWTGDSSKRIEVTSW